jgi:hypothetical protein
MKKTIVTFAIVLVTGCATYIQANNQCANPAMRFSETVICINKETDGSTNAYAVSYRLTANQLLEQLNTGKITETDAKMRLQDKFMQLRKGHIDAYNAVAGGSTYCTAVGKKSMYCY